MRTESGTRKSTVEDVKAKHENNLMSIEGVQGVGIGEESGKRIIKVYVNKKLKSLQDKIPTQIEGYPVRIEVSGEFEALDA